METTVQRRDLLKGGAGMAILATIGGVDRWCSPAAAQAARAPFKNLSASEGELMRGFADALVPGAGEAGCAHFVDHHIGLPAQDSLLILRYLDVPPPYADFYRAGLAALKRVADEAQGRWDTIVPSLLKGDVAGWNGPPPPLFYFTVRSDAVDALYGTRAGFARLGVDYLGHIDPEKDW